MASVTATAVGDNRPVTESSSAPKAQDSWGWSSSGESASNIFQTDEKVTSTGWDSDKSQAPHSKLDQGAAVPRAGESTRGWLNEATIAPNEAAPDGWTPDPTAETLDLPQEELDGSEWVDEDLEDYDDGFIEPQSALIQGAVVDDTASKFQWAFLAAVCLFFVSLAIVKTGKTPSEVAGTETAQVETVTAEDAAIYVNEGENNLSFGKHVDAAYQFAEAVEILEKAGAEPEKISAVKLRHAYALYEAKEFEAAYVIWKSLDGQEAAAGRKKIATHMRAQAEEILEKSKKTDDPRTAIGLAKEAESLYLKYGGEKSQIAIALEFQADAHLKEMNTPKARALLRQAQNYHFAEKRQKTLASLEIVKGRTAQKTSKTTKKTRPKKRPSLGGPSNVPKGNGHSTDLKVDDNSNNNAVREKTFAEKAREANANYVPPSSSSSNSSSGGGTRAGERDELKVYNRRPAGSGSKIPGL